MRDLLASIDAALAPSDPSLPAHPLQTAIAAVGDRDTERALTALTDYIKQNPDQSAALLANPAFFPIHSEIKQLLWKITSEAGTGANRLLAAATDAVNSTSKHPDELNGPAVLAVAERLVESAQLINYFRASELCRTVFAHYQAAPPGIARSSFTAGRGPQSARLPQWLTRKPIATLWRRAPLLLLLLGWLALGVAIGAAALLDRSAGIQFLSRSTVRTVFDLWGLGFLALIVFQFVVTIRRALLPKNPR